MVSGIITLCVLTVTAFGATLRVPSEYPRIQAAIQAASDGDMVLVSPGVYYETINFGGKDIVVTGTDPNDPKVVGYTIINAEEDGTVVTFENHETPAAVLTGFTITGGFGTYSQEFTNEVGVRTFGGAGIYCYYASPTITKNVIANNDGPFDVSGPTDADVMIAFGGGISCYEGSPVITHNIVRQNSAWVGGGILCWFGTPTINNNIIFGNSSYEGGGVFMFAGSLCNNTIVGNDGSLGSAIAAGEGIGANVFVTFLPEIGYTRVSNNIICQGVSGGGVFYQGDPPAGLFAYNNVWGNTSSDYGSVNMQTGELMYGGQSDLTGTMGNISQDPLFLNPFNKDYHLTFESPCVNAGDPDAFVLPGETDIDGDDRIRGARIDMGADEYVGYTKPVADAGFGRHLLEPFQPVTLDGTQSFFYDPCGVTTFRWTQVSGPAVTFDDPNVATPTFTPEEEGQYVFALVVADDRYSSEPDDVLVLIAENHAPVADAGMDRVSAIAARTVLDGTGSYDPDLVDRLTYRWTQVDGPPVVLEQADTATPSFVDEVGGQRVFELVVNDGFVDSEASRVRYVTVPVTMAAEAVDLAQGIPGRTYHPDVSGTRVVCASGGVSVDTWGIVSKDLITDEVETVATGGINTQPKIDGDLVVWSGGTPSRVAGRECTSVFVQNLVTGVRRVLAAQGETRSFGHPAVSGNKAVWVQHLNIDRSLPEQWHDMPYDICGADLTDIEAPVSFTVATGVGRRDPFPVDDPAADHDDVVDICGDIVVWEGNGDIYAADISDLNQIVVFTVCDHPARQYDPAISGHTVVWTDERNDEGDLYGADLGDWANIREFVVVRAAGVQQQPAIDGPLVAYVEGTMTRARLACLTRAYGVLTVELPELLFGTAPAVDGRTLAGLGADYGPLRGLSLTVGYAVDDGVVQNVTTGERYDYIQHAIARANDGDEIVVPEGIHEEKISFLGKAVTIRSMAPDDPAVVAATVLRSNGTLVSFTDREGPESRLTGLTITGGSQGIRCHAAAPTITRCTITDHAQMGLKLTGQSDPTIAHSRITGNGAAGISMATAGTGRIVNRNAATISNCVIAGNRGQGIHGDNPEISNCTIVENRQEGIHAYAPKVVNSILWLNGADVDNTQIRGARATAAISYCDVEGGWPGEGNLDADPLFVALGSWAGAAWTPGDYHLRSAGWRWDAGQGLWVSDDVTSPVIDAGDPASVLFDEPLTAPQDPGGPIINQRINMGAYGGTAEASLASASQ
jgi:beta propeller repeat protein